MGPILEKLPTSRRYVSVIVFLAALTYNNWLLAFIFNRRLLLHDGSVSELSVISQPHSWLFRLMDILSGLLFIVLAVLAYRLMKTSHTSRRWAYMLIIGVAAFGLANALDASFPLNCSDTLSRSCNMPIEIDFSRIILPSHAYSSLIIAVGYFLLPLAGYMYARSNRLRGLERVSLVTIGVAIFSCASAMHGYLHQKSLTVHTAGLPQEIQMLILGWWLVVWFYSIKPNELDLKEVAQPLVQARRR